jgi:hypothetical protein
LIVVGRRTIEQAIALGPQTIHRLQAHAKGGRKTAEGLPAALADVPAMAHFGARNSSDKSGSNRDLGGPI